MPEKYSVLIKYKYLEYIDNAKLSDADAWIFLKGIIEYDKTGMEPVYANPVLTGLFAVAKLDLDQNRENWEGVSKTRSKSGKKGAEARWGKKENEDIPDLTNGNNGNCYNDIAEMANANENSKCQNNEKNVAKMHDLDHDLDHEFVVDIKNSIGSAESGERKPHPQKTKKPPLREREPVNDFEVVEKAYLQNWDVLFSQNRVKTADPVVNWNQTRKLLKNYFEKLKPEQIVKAINSGMNDDFIMSGGYSLGTMLSASVLNRLINTSQRAPPQGLAGKESLTGLDSVF